ncbi:di-heme oxidoreductase family protein [Chondromyces apiculatus]|uniref:Putative thiol oxidoreductase with 2 cytochrome c heme-binding sites n=1 Tax=Chondromyces apiculatus DSM 436 TaxID=1192034 RepID=A0A017T6H2_9BACT|nr:di-heme oxidoredictase family protein [Chondromyces apiculatus]EYF04587.1 putative thiol oxidoreductase with 2 cytochrome c heme-binding sites [Chondromyces apiculatus DSM 436]
MVTATRVRARPAWILLAALAFASGCAKEEVPGPHGLEEDEGEELSGGETTVFDTSPTAFSYSARNMASERRSEFFVGNSFFRDNWVIAPASTKGRDGLGPLHNARSCSTCHFKDGRGRPPETESDPMAEMLVRLSVPGTDALGGPAPEPTYGGQLQPNGIPGVPGEGDARVTYEEVPGTYADGEPYSLRRPTIVIDAPGYGPFADDAMFSARIAPAMVGLGLLEAIPEATLLELADPDDADGDGISGRPNRVWDARTRSEVLGRFGWKAAVATVEQQTAAAFLGDMGITSDLHPDQDCTASQTDCLAALPGGEPGAPEASDIALARTTFYSATLAVPARRDWRDPTVQRGKELFLDAGCASCHTPRLMTGELTGYPELSHQDIRPFTDLLLHDMGDDLADHRPDFQASGREWRTPPLWGVGLVEVVNKHLFLLHDGRARGFAEAILWHGGEAERARDTFKSMPASEREALLRFLESL